MTDILTRLATLHDVAPQPVDDGVIAADLHRGRTALVRRRVRVGLVGAFAVGVVTVGTVSIATAANDTPTAPQAATSASPDTRPTSPPVSPAQIDTISLVTYTGAQLPGFAVTQVPEGYVLQGISGSVLAVAEAGDHSPLDTFEGKLVVILDDHPGPATGDAVTVGGRPGRVNVQDGTMMLTYDDGSHDITVQAWDTIRLTKAQLVAFAEGVTVLPGAEVGHG